jgi:CHAT domain-containing protein
MAERAVVLAREMGRQIDLWLSLAAVGDVQLALNRPSEARQAFAEAVSIIEKLRSQSAGGVEERQRYFENGLRAHHGLLTSLIKVNETQQALIFAERAKARTLLDMLQEGHVSIEKAMTVEEQERERRLKSELTQLNKQLGRAARADKPDRAHVGELESRLEKARRTYEAFQNSLYAAHPELKVQRGEAPIINAGELAALLPNPSDALLEYVVTEDHTYLFAVTRAAGEMEADARVYTLPIKRDELSSRIEAFRRQLAERDLGFRKPALRLYNLLLKPAEAQLRGKTSLIIAPDHTLWDLPFQALLTTSNRFLIEQGAISYAPSLTVLREMTRRPKNPAADDESVPLLALGNPLVGIQTTKRAALNLRDEDLAPLPEAEQEVRTLRRLYGESRSRVYIGAQAREERVKTEAGRARILHFATHGTLNNASPMYSHLALAQGGAKEDGLLEAWELMQLDLKADLAVLSACETARGRIGAGEGMIGLSWAMFIAGVPTIVVSQWKVEAAATRDLMVNFHRGLISQPEGGKARTLKSEALRQSALKLLKEPETRHPFYWAGFVLVGDGR